MLYRLLDPRDGNPREPVFWLVVAAVVCAQLLAFYLVCTHQVRRAEARLAQVEVERMASNDCLQYMAQSTIASCATRTMGAPRADVPPDYAIR
ncbi:hypothetical protein [Ramlibacter humi]|uniref:Uncharacterized protein n=1 Tax=Ramlibacter humi TaxID=2530451 RepID=A0A4Z0BJI5_9BURK|nr:hypothetical protein [Ramlibacter humi]TFY98941.1 hypothetical protein EZ216_15350 [Ramlibacter humi]